MATNMKQVLLKKKIEGVIYDLYVKTAANLVSYDDSTTVAQKIAAVEAIANKAKQDLATLMGGDASKSISAMIDDKVTALKTALTDESDATSLAGKIKANASAAAAASKAASNEAARAKAAEKTLTDNLGTANTKLTALIGTDANKSARSIAAEEIAKQLIPENASEALDTLQEIAAWIQSHPGEAAEMNKKITALETKTGTIPTSGTGANSKDLVAYIQAMVSAEASTARAAESANKTAAAAASTAASKAQGTADKAARDLTAEVTRAKGAESANATRITNLGKKVGDIPTTGIGANAATVIAYAQALAADAKKAATNEATRAKAAEGTLTTAVNARARFLVSATEPKDLTESDVWAQIIE